MIIFATPATSSLLFSFLHSLESFALSWINLAIMQGYGRDIAFKVIRR